MRTSAVSPRPARVSLLTSEAGGAPTGQSAVSPAARSLCAMGAGVPSHPCQGPCSPHGVSLLLPARGLLFCTLLSPSLEKKRVISCSLLFCEDAHAQHSCAKPGELWVVRAGGLRRCPKAPAQGPSQGGEVVVFN